MSREKRIITHLLGEHFSERSRFPAIGMICRYVMMIYTRHSSSKMKHISPLSFRLSICVCLLLSISYKGAAFLFGCSSPRVRNAFVLSARYGPPQAPPPPLDDATSRSELKAAFRSLLEQSVRLPRREHLPGFLSKNIEVIMSLEGEEGAQVVTEFVQDAKKQSPEAFFRAAKTADLVLTFAEGVAIEVSQLDEQNKKTLGRIMKGLTNKDKSVHDREESFDQLMLAERENFTPSFLRHLEGECQRIMNLPTMTPESTRALQLVSMIQARVLEELGQGMGDAAVFLGRLMGYDSEDELIAVLESGLTVRGTDFVRELSGLCKEALDGFLKVHGGVDPQLVRRVKTVDSRLDEILLGSDDKVQA